MRVWLVPFLVAMVAPSVAQADLGMGVPGIEVRIPTDFEDAGSATAGDYTVQDATSTLRYFNLARCSCDAGGDEQRAYVLFDWATMPTGPVSGQIDVYTGVDCESFEVDERPDHCTELEAINDAADLAGTVKRFVNLKDMLTPAATATGCDPQVSQSAINLYTDVSGALTEVATYPIMPIDMDAPEVPTTVDVEAQEGQITVSWDEIDSGVADYEYFQALCAKSGGLEAHVEPTHSAKFDTVASVCQAPIPDLEALMIDPDATFVGDGVNLTDLPLGLRQLEEAFICGESSGSSESVTLGDLDNGIAYVVVLVAMDKAGNSTARYLPKTVTPQPVTDFWEDLNEDNPEFEGGLCLIESTFGAGGGGGGLYGALRAWRDELSSTAAGRWMVARYYGWGAPLAHAAQQSVIVRVILAIVLAPLVVVALAWHLLGLPLLLALIAGAILLRRLRRHRRTVLAAAALLASPAVAAAQGTSPYWDEASVSEETEVGPRWHFGIRLGPFLPSIDDERLDENPYDRMFGGGSWMPSLDLHRLFGTRFGQIGAGVSAGYFGKTGDSWKPGSNTERADDNPSKLRIVPLELTAIYRLSQLDDNWGIPFVPYARGGLAYSLWWVRRPDGELSKSCEMENAQCDRGIGGSLGLVGAVGLSVRAERIDGDAARSMRDSGLDHAGFYAEVSASWVDGFGSSKKLSLGDTTWSAGVDFEF